MSGYRAKVEREHARIIEEGEHSELTERVARRAGLSHMAEVQLWLKDHLTQSVLAGRISGDLIVETWEAFDAVPGDRDVWTAASGRRVWSKAVVVKGTPTANLRLTYFEGMDLNEPEGVSA